MILSVLDQSPVPDGSTAASALRESLNLAQQAERHGYRRYWLAEHHNTSSLAGSAPEVLAAHVASQTSTLRVGAGGILLSHYSPLKVAETFRVLEALFPGRVDLGIGRADAGPSPVVSWLQCGATPVGEDEYRRKVVDLIRFLDDATVDDPGAGDVRAMPAGVGQPEVWVLSSSSVGAGLAAQLGLPLSFAHFVSPRYARQILAAYRAEFQPSAWCHQPTANLGVSVVCADTDEEAHRLAASDDVWHVQSHDGVRGRLPSAAEAEAFLPTPLQKELMAEHRRRRIVGVPERVHDDLCALAAACGVGELVVRTICHDPAARLHSYVLLAEVFGLERPVGPGD